MKIEFAHFKRFLLSRNTLLQWKIYFTLHQKRVGYMDSCCKHALSSKRNQRQYSPHNNEQLRISSTSKKGKRRRDWKQKTSRQADEKSFFLRMKELLRKVGGRNERNKNARKRKIDAEKREKNITL